MKGDGRRDAWHESLALVVTTFIERLLQPLVILPLVLVFVLVLGLLNVNVVERLVGALGGLWCR